MTLYGAGLQSQTCHKDFTIYPNTCTNFSTYYLILLIYFSLILPSLHLKINILLLSINYYAFSI